METLSLIILWVDIIQEEEQEDEGCEEDGV